MLCAENEAAHNAREATPPCQPVEPLHALCSPSLSKADSARHNVYLHVQHFARGVADARWDNEARLL